MGGICQSVRNLFRGASMHSCCIATSNVFNDELLFDINMLRAIFDCWFFSNWKAIFIIHFDTNPNWLHRNLHRFAIRYSHNASLRAKANVIYSATTVLWSRIICFFASPVYRSICKDENKFLQSTVNFTSLDNSHISYILDLRDLHFPCKSFQACSALQISYYMLGTLQILSGGILQNSGQIASGKRQYLTWWCRNIQ